MSDIEDNGYINLANDIGSVGSSQKRLSVLSAQVGGYLPNYELFDGADYYKFRVDETGFLDIQILGSDGKAINYELYDSSGRLVLRNDSGSWTINHPVSAGTYYIGLEADQFTQNGSRYGVGLEWQRSIVPSPLPSVVLPGGGTSARDILSATDTNHFIDGGDGNDDIRARNSTSVPLILFGDSDNDLLYGGSNNDQLFGEHDYRVRPSLDPDFGNDTIYGGAGDDYIDGGEGNDWLYGQLDQDFMNGRSGNDYMFGGVGHDQLHGEDGNDFIDGQDGEDYIWGGNNEDILFGDSRNDRLFGGDGNDQLFGEHDYRVRAWMNPNAGDDLLYGGLGHDYIDGGQGNDTLYGGSGHDFLNGRSESDRIFGGNGHDQLHGEDGNDFLDGEDGDDTIWGGNGDDQIAAGKGDDILYGGTGSDRIVFEEGRDVGTGGDGTDQFGFANPRGDVHLVTDFNSAENDVIMVGDYGFGGGLKVGQLPASQFVLGSSSTSASHRFIFDSSKGMLSFDPDGSGPLSQKAFLKLKNVDTLSASDIVVV